MADGDAGGLSLDTWMALLSGAAPWWDDDDGERAWGRLLALGQLTGATLCLLMVFIAQSHDGTAWLTTVALAAATLVLSTQPLFGLFGRQPRPRAAWSSLVMRLALLATVWLLIRALLPGWLALWSTPMAAVLALDIVTTCRHLGWEPRAAFWYRNFLLSGFHLGITGALVATYFFAEWGTFTIALHNFVCLHAWALVAGLTLWAVGGLQRHALREQEQHTSRVIAAEHRSRAHWLHDDVCAQLRLVSLRLSTEEVSKAEVLELLDDLDHQLRLRQLEELLGTNRVSIAEVLQPFIRHAHNRGVAIEGVPAFDRAAAELPSHPARLAARVAGVLTSNALNSGATAISYMVHSDDDSLRLTVEDNGPGFDLATVPPGRGLSALIEELQPGTLDVRPRSDGGSVVTAVIPYVGRIANGVHTAR